MHTASKYVTTDLRAA